MKNILIIILLITPMACSNLILKKNTTGKKRFVDICSAQIKLSNEYAVSCFIEEKTGESLCYIKKDSDSLLIWCDGYTQAEIYLVDLDLESLTKPSGVDLETSHMKELKDVRRIEFRSIGDAFMIIDYGPKGERKNDRGALEILYYDTKLKQKLVFTTINKELEEGFDQIPHNFRKDIVKALKTIKFVS